MLRVEEEQPATARANTYTPVWQTLKTQKQQKMQMKTWATALQSATLWHPRIKDEDIVEDCGDILAVYSPAKKY